TRLSGLGQDARATWSVAQAAWPNDVRFGEALSGPRKSAVAWYDETYALRAPAAAEQLAVCGHFYTDLGMEARAQECYRWSERILRGPALAHQLVHLAVTSPGEALAKAVEAIRTNPEVNLLSAAGWIELHQHHYEAAKSWVQRALGANPDDAK